MTYRPQLPDLALHGLAGDVVNLTSPHTEASRTAILFTFLATAGAYLGAGPHMYAGEAFHPARLWPLIVGPTSNGMKGTSWNVVAKILETTDVHFAAEHTASGLSSAEGLIERVRDPNGADPDAEGFDEGIIDKRLIVTESEFAAVLGRARREGNVLSPVLRDVWDGKRLQTMTRKVNALIATGHHVAVIGHITPTELIAKLSDSDMAGGLINRFLPVHSVRSKRLPDGGGTPHDVLEHLAGRLRQARDKTRHVGRMHRTDDARKLWAHTYAELTPEDLPEGPISWVSARAVPQVIRLSVAYALLDGRDEIDVDHLTAALACWGYVKASVNHVFGGTTGNRNLDKLCEFLDGTEDPRGATRKQIVDKLFQRNLGRDAIDRLMGELMALGDYETWDEPTGGRPRTWVRRRPAEDPPSAATVVWGPAS